MQTAIVAYSFGGSLIHGTGRANKALAEIARKARERTGALLITQDWIAECLQNLPDFVIWEHRVPGKFLNTKEVTAQAAEFLKARGVARVLLVAHPFLHWARCEYFLQRHGFTVERERTGWVPFDRNCESWWVRSPFHLLLYGALRKLSGKNGS